jgi:aspartate/methionine/tyrosine aminotransferase
MLPIKKPTKHNFFITKKQIDNLKLNWWINIFYFTPVWNPTWEKIWNKEFLEVIKYISKNDKNAIFLVDNAYTWLLKKEIRFDMFKNMFKSRGLLNQVIFVESLSKTIWMTWVRLWWLWSTNDTLATFLKKNTMLKKHWFSKLLSEFWTNILSDLNKIENFQRNISDFFSKQRNNFLAYMKKNFSYFFDLKWSAKVNDNEWIYVFLKIKSWITYKEIVIETWIIWIEINLSDWNYIRYSFWIME